MQEVDECWHFETGGRQYPEECVRVKLDYVPNRNGRDVTLWGGKRTVVASCLSFMWSPKDTARLIACLRQCASFEVVTVRKSDSRSVTKGFKYRPCSDMLIYSNNLVGCR